MADRNVTAGAGYVATIATGNRNVTANAAYIPTSATGNRNVTAAATYAVVVPYRPAAVTAGNVFATFGTFDLTGYLSTASLLSAAAAIVSTNYADEGETFIAGLPTYTVQIGGNGWDKTLDNTLGKDGVNPTVRTFVMRIGRAWGVSYEWAEAFISDYSVALGKASETVTWTATLTCLGAPTRA